MYSSAAIANRFLELAKADTAVVTPMKLQKIVYFAHGWHLAYTDRPLCHDRLEAWQWGPVFPALYHAVKKWGNRPILAPVNEFLDLGGDHLIVLRSLFPRRK